MSEVREGTQRYVYPPSTQGKKVRLGTHVFRRVPEYLPGTLYLAPLSEIQPHPWSTPND